MGNFISNIDYYILFLIAAYITYYFISEYFNRINGCVKRIEVLGSRMEEQITAVRNIYLQIKDDVELISEEKERIFQWQSQLQSEQDRYIELENERLKKKEKYEKDLENARSRADKYEKRAKDVETKLAELLSKVSV